MAMALANNGVNVQALLDAREALKGAPGATAFTWRVNHGKLSASVPSMSKMTRR